MQGVGEIGLWLGSKRVWGIEIKTAAQGCGFTCLSSKSFSEFYIYEIALFIKSSSKRVKYEYDFSYLEVK